MSKEMYELVGDLNYKLPENMSDNGMIFSYSNNGFCEAIEFIGYILWDCQNSYDDMLKYKVLKRIGLNSDDYEEYEDYEDAVYKVFPDTPTCSALLLLAKELSVSMQKGLYKIDLTDESF